MGTLIRFRHRRRAKKDAGARLLFPGLTPDPASDDAKHLSGTDARPARFNSDASPADDLARAGAAPDPAQERRHKRRRRTLVLVLATVFVLGVIVSVFAGEGILDVRRQEVALARMAADVDAHQKQVAALKREVDRLGRDPAAIERLAREQLGYAAHGEVVLLLPGEDPKDPGHLDARGGSAIVSPVTSTP